jgi:hypothetical protein
MTPMLSGDPATRTAANTSIPIIAIGCSQAAARPCRPVEQLTDDELTEILRMHEESEQK